jgi:uncharacterized Zn-binding protein involved in type VI secretion
MDCAKTPPVHRISDLCSGHDCFPPRPSTSGSNNVFVNSLAWHRKGDAYAAHTCGDNTHRAVSVRGSAGVYVNSRSAVRVSDALSCGSVAARGSPNVYCG